MILGYLKKSKNSIKLACDGLFKIITGLIIIKLISNINDDALLANFSQLKMVSALFIAVSSSVFIIGLNKLSLKYDGTHYVGGTFLIVLCLSILVGSGGYVFNDEIQVLIGRRVEIFYILLFVFITCGFIANYFIGCKVATNDNESIANGKLFATISSFIIFLSLYYFNVEIWLGLFLYLIAYYLILSISLFDKSLFFFLRTPLKLTKRLFVELWGIYFLTLVSAIIFPSCILFFRYNLSLNESWQMVSLWEAEWQLSSLMLLVLSPVLSISLTTFFTNKLKKSEVTRELLVKTVLFFIVFSIIFSIAIYLLKGMLITLLFNAEMLSSLYTSSFFMLLTINFFRLVSIVIFYILYVIIDTKRLIYSELLFGLVFVVGLLLEIGGKENLDMYLLVPVISSFTYLLALLVKSNEFKNNI